MSIIIKKIINYDGGLTKFKKFYLKSIKYQKIKFDHLTS